MISRKLLFVSGNPLKLEDILDLAGSTEDRDIEHFALDIVEIQSTSLDQVIERKVSEAFRKLHRPLFIDHTSLELDALGGYPGTNSGAFWDRAGDRICQISHAIDMPSAAVEVGLGYTDGISIYIFKERVEGKISETPRGSRTFDWDQVFIPAGQSRTYAEMTVQEKNDLSPRAVAFRKMLKHLERPEIERRK